MTDAPKKSKGLVKHGKLLFGLSLLAFVLFSQGNAGRIFQLFSDIRVSMILALVGISLCLTMTNVTKWRLFLSGIGQRIPLWRLFALYLVGKFFSNFAPSTMGGDLARIYLLGRNIGSHTQSAATVIMERAMGMVGLVAVAVVALTLNPILLKDPFISIPVAVAVAACLAAVTAYFHPAVSNFMIEICRRLPLLRRFSGIIGKFVNAVVCYREDRLLILKSLLLSMQFHFLASVNVYTACLAIGFRPQFFDVLVITPVVLLLTAIPVSPRSIGWWEWCFGVFLANAGGSMAEGTAVALLLRAVAIVMSLLGGLFFALDGKCGLRIFPDQSREDRQASDPETGQEIPDGQFCPEARQQADGNTLVRVS